MRGHTLRAPRLVPFAEAMQVATPTLDGGWGALRLTWRDIFRTPSGPPCRGCGRATVRVLLRRNGGEPAYRFRARDGLFADACPLCNKVGVSWRWDEWVLGTSPDPANAPVFCPIGREMLVRDAQSPSLLRRCQHGVFVPIDAISEKIGFDAWRIHVERGVSGGRPCAYCDDVGRVVWPSSRSPVNACDDCGSAWIDREVLEALERTHPRSDASELIALMVSS